jgi:hypothetical protein
MLWKLLKCNNHSDRIRLWLGEESKALSQQLGLYLKVSSLLLRLFALRTLRSYRAKLDRHSLRKRRDWHQKDVEVITTTTAVKEHHICLGCSLLPILPPDTRTGPRKIQTKARHAMSLYS